MLSLAVCAVLMSTPQDYRKNLNTFMDVERAFSRLAAMQGIRNSFLHFFAPECIAFNPEAYVAKEELENQPEEKKPLDYLLAWEPRIADCSSRGDLGFTTGPAKYIDLSPAKRPIRHMAYFSIWKKMPDGELKIVLDMGTPLAAEPDFPKQMKVRGEPRPAFVTADMVDRTRTLIDRFEEDIRKSTPAELPKTLEMIYNKELIAYRSQAMPLQSAAEALDWTKKNQPALKEWELRKIEIAESADLAWCWGSYSGTIGGKPARGYWAHVWKCEVGKGWHIVADTMSILPPKE